MDNRRSGFTLVELLVVVAIIGILIALLVPALGAVQEAGRQTTCKNNLRQIGEGCNAHREKLGYFPSGGWGYLWAGDPDRGFNHKQPGGWMYNLLPFIGETDLHDAGKSLSDSAKRAKGMFRVQQVIPLFLCPSRRRPDQIPYTIADNYYNVDRPPSTGRNDYVCNSGDRLFKGVTGPKSLAAGEAMSEEQWIASSSNTKDPTSGQLLPCNGAIYQRSEVKTCPDGDTCTYLAGEKHLNSATYFTNGPDNNQGWDLGYDWDVCRWTYSAPSPDDPYDKPEVFGSIHTNGFAMVFCDSHVQTVSYFIDPAVHKQLGNRNDGVTTDTKLAD